MHKDITLLMRRMGLKDRDGRVYIACLQNKGGLFVHEIVKQTRVGRSTVDLIARRLLAQGFLNKVKAGRRTRYMAVAPEALLFRQKQLAEDLEQVVPLLSKIGGPRREMEILHFEGLEGFVRVHDDVLLETKFATGEKRHILSFSSGPDFIKAYPGIQNFIKKRVKNGIWYKAISSYDSYKVPIWNNDPKVLRAMKYLPKNLDFRIEAQIYADSVMLYSPSPPIGGVIIRNEKIADSMRTIFNLVWSLLPESAT